MPIENFNFQEFSKNLAQQASSVVPSDITENDKTYVINLVYSYCNLAGDALSKDESLTLNSEQACVICQFIGEWTFHKAIDTIRSNLPVHFRDEVLQKVAFTVFEIAKLAIVRNMPMNQVIMLVEQHVKKSFDEAVLDLQTRGVISEQDAQAATNASNLDKMAEQQQATQTQEEYPVSGAGQAPPAQKQPDNKVLKLASFALILKKLPREKILSLLKKFPQEDAELIYQYVQMPDLETKLDSGLAVKYLKEIKQNLPESNMVNKNKIVLKLNKIVNNSNISEISTIIINERPNVKKLISASYDKSEFEFPARVTEVICSYLEEKVKT